MSQAKYLLGIGAFGGFDGLHIFPPRDAPSTTILSNFRQAAAGMVLDYTEAISRTGTLTANSDTVTGITVSGISTGMHVYGDGIPRQRGLTVLAVGGSTIQLSEPAYESVSGGTLYFNTATQLYKANETPSTGRNPAWHFRQRFLADAFNVPDTVPNANKVKAAVIAGIGPLRRKLVKNGTNGSIFNTLVALEGGGTRPSTGADVPAQLTSHNDQQSTWSSNGPEGETEGWGGGIADTFLNEISGDLNVPLASVSASGAMVFTAGTQALPFNISSNGLVRNYPAFDGGGFRDLNATASPLLRQLLIDASKLDPSGFQNDFIDSAIRANQTAIDYQNVLLNVMEITDPPTSGALGFNPTNSMGPAIPTTTLRNLKQIARLWHANSPNRGGTATRSGNIVTISTEVTVGVANRTAGQTKTTITSANHRLFTSNLSSNTSDSVIVLGDGAAIDTSIPAGGYKITLEPSDPNNKFFFTSTQTTALVDAPVTIRLKHNLQVGNKVYFDDVENFDTVAQPNGYDVLSVPSNVQFTVATTATGAFTPSTVTLKYKLINLPKMVTYTETPAINWDSHNGTNEGPQQALNQCLEYFNSLVERMNDVNYVGFSITEFGRTIGVNAGGTDHGWGNIAWVFGKNVKGNRVYGDLPDLSPTGPDIVTNMILPKISVYQYGATLAKWMGANDAEVLNLFPDLVNWPTNEWYLGFL